ncbi:MAG: DNA repair protein RadC [Erysipelotrichaceae bacterium]|nr:DNA repair protein RadC [Erysipelotrichaceae bacterium]MBR5048967.1 DNA repair protein RadC [Erysipelotrichaceae bacterium]
MHLKDFDRSLRPREKALDSGIESLSDSELLALILRSGVKGQNAVALASGILNQTGGLAGLFGMPLNQLMELPGIGLAKGSELMACLELLKRVNYQKMLMSDVISSPRELISWLSSCIGCRDQEYFVAVFLNSRNRVTGFQRLAQGTGNCVTVSPSEIYSQAMKLKAASLIVAHNHPSQQVEPSLADNLTTVQLQKAGEMLSIPLKDHIIVCFNDYFSYHEHQMI